MFDIFSNIRENTKKFILKQYIQKMYKKFSSFYFPIFSHAPKYMNLAYPDFSIQYFILSLKKDETIMIEGKIPKDKIVFWSITLYDNQALPYWSRNDTDVPFVDYKYNITVDKPSALIVRFYVKDEYVQEDFFNYLPSLSPSRPFVSKTKRIQNSQELFTDMKQQISRRFQSINPDILKQHYFFYPGVDRRESLFTNPNAFYLAAFPSSNDCILNVKINTKLLKNIRFAGFMTCNRQTTETYHSIALSFNKKYEIIMCHSKNVKKIPEKYKKNPILTWKEVPILIYRLVIVEHNHPILKLNKKEHDIFYPAIETKMKEYYPSITQIN